MSQQEEIYISKYAFKLECLIDGYTKEHAGEVDIPVALLRYIGKWYTGESLPKLNFKLVCEDNPVEFQCFWTQKLQKIINIKQYKFIYKPEKNCEPIFTDSQLVIPNNEYIMNNNYITTCFFGLVQDFDNKKKFGESSISNWEISVIDTNDDVVVKLQTKIQIDLMQCLINTKMVLWSHGIELKYFDKHTKYNLQKWIKTLKIKTEIVNNNNILLLQRLFVWMIDSISYYNNNNNNEISYQQMKKFINNPSRLESNLELYFPLKELYDKCLLFLCDDDALLDFP